MSGVLNTLLLGTIYTRNVVTAGYRRQRVL